MIDKKTTSHVHVYIIIFLVLFIKCLCKGESTWEHCLGPED